MIHHIYHSLVPNKANRFKPHILHGPVLWMALLLIFGLQLNYNLALGSGKLLGYATDITVAELLSLTNQERSDVGAAGLSLDTKLNSAASAKANDMITKDYWAHTSPSGKEPWEFIQEAGYSYSYAGENLAYGFTTSNGTMNGWMNSPGHKANVLNSNYTEVGFAVVDGSNYQGGENTLVVAMYGKPLGSSGSGAGGSQPSSQPQVAAAPKPAPTTAPTQQTTPPPEPVVEEPNPDPELTQAQDQDDVAALTEPVESAPPTTGYNVTEPLFLWQNLSWPAMTGASFMGLAAVSSGLRHYHFWQHHKPRHIVHWLKTHPVLQTVALVAGLFAILSSGMGMVG